MITILVCGSQHYANVERMTEVLDEYLKRHLQVTIIHGAAPGADTMAEVWAIRRGQLHRSYPADWRKHGRALAGKVRNREMLLHERTKIDLVLSFIGGTGTADMTDLCRRSGLKVEEIV